MGKGMQEIDLSTVFCSRPDVVACEIESGSALLDLDSSRYFRLNGSASYVWQIIQQPIPLGDICKQMLDHYDVEEEQCLADIIAVLTAFEKAGLVDRDPA